MNPLKPFLILFLAILSSVFHLRAQTFEYEFEEVVTGLLNRDREVIGDTGPFKATIRKKAAQGFEFVQAVEIPSTSLVDRPFLYILTFKRVKNPAQEYLQRLASNVDSFAKTYLDKELASLKMTMMDEINKVTANTLTDKFRTEMQEYFNKQISLVADDLRKKIELQIQNAGK